MGRLKMLVFSAVALTYLLQASNAGETVLSTVLTPSNAEVLSRQGRSYYDDRYGLGRPYDRLEYDRPARCGRCDERYDDDYDRPRDRYDDDRRGHRPSNRFDKNKNYDDDDDRKFGSDRRKTNGTDDTDDEAKKRPYDDEKRPSGSGGRRDRDRDRDRNRYDDRDRYRPDYYDRFLRDPYRERERPYYDDPYRRPSYERYPYQERYDEGYGGGYGGGYSGGANGGYRRPVGGYDERYDRGNGYDDIYGGYGPSAGRGPHDSFRPWDETYRGQAGWDAGGRGYYFASGRPDAGAAGAWGRPQYNSRPEVSSGWQNVYRERDPYASGGGGYAPDTGYGGYRQDLAASYGRPSGWHSVSARPYRDQSGVNSLETRPNYNQPSRTQSNAYGQDNRGQSYGQANYGQANYGQATYGQTTSGSSSTTPGTSYLYQREDEQVTTKVVDETTKPPS
ncbi:translation initiation factor IF-2 isoform X1 [Cydia strobilella]|uniref:translation initiation factor IF-2 isoform X1 n=1 Tax=Cydia strobilella TaxID=1100964 RepID=UPI003007BC65